VRRGGPFLLGIGVTAAALAFGSRPLGVAGVGLLLAAVATRVWAGLVRGEVSVSFTPIPPTVHERERVRLKIEALRSSQVPVGSAVVHGILGRLGDFSCRLRGHGRRLTGEVDLGRLPRGRFSLSDARLVLGDHLGLESVSRPVRTDGFAIVVWPRLVELDTLFNEAGRLGDNGRRLLLHRPAGYDLHSVRAYAQGESLRRVHWPTTARTGQLMVKELEDTPRDSVVVLLDCDPACAAGRPPDSSFDAAVRVAGSLVLHHASRAKRCTLVTTGKEGAVLPVNTLDGDFAAMLGTLAAAEPDAIHGVASWLQQLHRRTPETGELLVVTANLEPSATEALLAAAARRLVSVVWIDAPSYAGKPTRAATGPLRLSAAGIPTAVVRQGEDLAAALDLSRVEVGALG
jgi:uncharacterized protein (DUF58 family)